MGGAVVHRSARRYRRARRLRAERRGVVAVVGTLLALLVFFALFGIFLTQYLPLWMTDNESAFTSSTGTSFAQFKADVDTQYVLGVPPTLGVPFAISSQGIPLLAQPTQGTLNFFPQTCPGGFSPATGQPVNPAYCVFENQTIKPGFGGVGVNSFEVTTGVLNMVLPNRYFTGESFSYEADGIVQVQSSSYQLMAYAPPFNVTRLASNTTVSASFLQLYGNSTSLVGQGSEEVYSHLKFAQHLAYNGYNSATKKFQAFNYTFEIGTQFPCAWSKFLQTMMNSSGIARGNYTFNPYTGSCATALGATTELTLSLPAVNYASLFYAGTVVTVGIGTA